MMDKQEQNLIPRPPIVAVMGHIDHGKSSLLDFIRKTNVVTKEAGGITQSIGAYEIIHMQMHADQNADARGSNINADQKGSQHKSAREILRSTQDDFAAKSHKITFIDTPGHEAFSKMRSRGANVADLAILVVAADDGVKPQTKEVIEVLKETKTPFVVAINKIDKPNANVEMTKQSLMQAGVLLEKYGGDVSWQEISAKTGQGINELLDIILLTAEMENLTYDPQAPAQGVIIESKMESSRGATVTAIIKNGVLKIGDEIATASTKGKVKILENFLGKRIESAAPSSPVLILGFEKLPLMGEEFRRANPEAEQSRYGADSAPLPDGSGNTNTPIRIIEESNPQKAQKDINIILKADVSGSLEALAGIISGPRNENAADGQNGSLKFKIISQGVGEINSNDIQLAISTKAIIMGFRTKLDKSASILARANNVKVIISEIIYELLEKAKEESRALAKPALNGQLEVLAIFNVKGKKQTVGGKIVSGVFRKNLNIKIQRQEEIIGQGKIINLQSQKKDVNQASIGQECGMVLESEAVVSVGDQLIY